MGKWFETLQDVGKALMLPVAVLPAAALLLRLGAPDVLDIPFVTKSGAAVFENLPLIFAVGIAVGLAKDGGGAAGLSGCIGYLVLTAALGSIDASLSLGILGGVVSGFAAGALYNHFHTIKMPEFLGFFSGRRFVPIVTAAASILLAALFSAVWPPCQAAIHSLGGWIVSAGAIGTFIYGVLNRLLIPVGMHHILNSLVWFVFGEYTSPSTGELATGDLNRFFLGDPEAGVFMAGFFPMMMFGMPAAALAMYRAASPERRGLVGGMLASAALASFLTGITEPIEFLFMFQAPALYVVHAILTGLSLSVTYALGVLDGFGFSAGLIDYVLNWGLATHPERIIPIGLALGAIYYTVFSWAIRRFDIRTVGRKSPEGEGANAEEASSAAPPPDVAGEMDRLARDIVAGLGGMDNLAEVSNCVTRLRISVRDPAAVDETVLGSVAGVKGVIRRGNAVQVVIGTQAEQVASEIRECGRR